ncbi:response regulator transcription factor [Blastococcus mobilis]|uniref:Two component transcriptional regulator, LuxR family n=1 Tax=Blastococcus mobilis TaxID=1938746 RepID=A0A238ZAE5_9ACTN|nr:response regulator transcription factor [Blastococcus mobilis]SNR80515.1 two component transcriptional regulator, LuxR family [Blastococcus mobilis]
MTVTVVVAEDHLLVREGLRQLLDGGDTTVLATADDLPSLQAAVTEHRPAVVITDLRMPPTGTDEGIRAARWLREAHPDTGLLLLSQYLDVGGALALLADGGRGRGYLLKQHVTRPDVVRRAVREVGDGGCYVDPDVVELLVHRASSRSRLAALTSRELEVLAQMAQGRSNTAIARELFVTYRAVEKHINSLFAKLGLAEEDSVHRRVAAVLMYLDEQP